jgi:DNA-binding transcriptional ArsR family regulator
MPKTDTDDEELLQHIEFFKHLGQGIRLKILEALLDGEKNVSELQEIIKEVPQGRLSTHLT